MLSRLPSGRTGVGEANHCSILDNACRDLLPGERTVRAIHMCRGSRTTERGTDDHEWLAERLFHQLRVDRLLLEYDSDRIGSFELLRFLPKRKTVVFGLITSNDPRPENEDDRLRRIDEASSDAPLEQLAISPQSGFGGSADNAFHDTGSAVAEARTGGSRGRPRVGACGSSVLTGTRI